MDLSTFDLELKRLSSQWPNAYGEQRRKILFNAFKDVANADFREAVTYCLGTCRSAPLLTELTDAIAKARLNYFNQKRIDEATQRGIFNSIPDAGTCDKEFQQKCVEHYNSFRDNKITKEQFDQGCNLLDQAANLYAKKHNTQQIKSTQLARPYAIEQDEKPY